MKLNVEDIVILGQGQQIKRAIIEKFGSIDEFIRLGNITISRNTIDNYLRRSEIISDKFKFKIYQTFNMGFDEIIKSPEQQIKVYTDEVYTHITNYRDAEDIKVLNKIFNLSESYNLGLEIAKMQLIIGMHYRLRTDNVKAYEYYKLAENKLQLRNAHKYLITLYAELATVYFNAKETSKAEELYNKIELHMADCKELDSRMLFNYLYNIGILYNNNSKYELAYNLFSKALAHANPGLEYGSVIMNIGLSWKRRGEYLKAIKYYKQTLIEFENVEKVKKSIVYNNLAEIYRNLKDFDAALLNVNKAFNILDGLKNNYYIMTLLSYVQILYDMKNTEKAEKETTSLIDFIESCEQYNIHNKYILECLKYIQAKASETKNIAFLTKLSKVVAYLIRQSYNDEYTRELKTIFADIHLSLE